MKGVCLLISSANLHFVSQITANDDSNFISVNVDLPN